MKEQKKEAQNQENNLQEKFEVQQKQLEGQKKTIDEYTDRLKRLQAEFENYVKRNERERAGVADYAIDQFLTKVLVVIDEFHHALHHSQRAGKEEVIKGVEMIFSKLSKVLEEEGVRPIESKGKLFDQNYHEVMLTEVTDKAPENTVLDELQKGYMRKNRVLRYARVKIAKPKTTEE